MPFVARFVLLAVAALSAVAGGRALELGSTPAEDCCADEACCCAAEASSCCASDPADERAPRWTAGCSCGDHEGHGIALLGPRIGAPPTREASTRAVPTSSEPVPDPLAPRSTTSAPELRPPRG